MSVDPTTMELLRVLDRWAAEQAALGVPRMLVGVTACMHAVDGYDKAMREQLGITQKRKADEPS